MYTKLEAVERRYFELESLLVSPEVIGNRKDFAKLAKERSDLEEIVRTFREWKDVQGQIEGSKSLLQDADEGDAGARAGGAARAAEPERRARGPAEAAAPAARSERRPQRRARDPRRHRRRRGEPLRAPSSSACTRATPSGRAGASRCCQLEPDRARRLQGGHRARSQGQGAFSRLKFEGGVHRVQRVPETESAGPHPHLGGHRRGAARGRGGRRRRSTTRICGSTSTARRARAGRASTRRTPRCA